MGHDLYTYGRIAHRNREGADKRGIEKWRARGRDFPQDVKRIAKNPIGRGKKAGKIPETA
jgi:hypothetical protein